MGFPGRRGREVWTDRGEHFTTIVAATAAVGLRSHVAILDALDRPDRTAAGRRWYGHAPAWAQRLNAEAERQRIASIRVSGGKHGRVHLGTDVGRGKLSDCTVCELRQKSLPETACDSQPATCQTQPLREGRA